MLYPKSYKKKKGKVVKEKIKVIRSDTKSFFKSFKSFKDFVRFLAKKFHF